jgi:hypothetical protein
MKALQSDKGQEMLTQLRGPVMSAGRQAALSMFEAQAGRLSDSMSRRTDMLTAPADSKTDNKKGSAGKRSRKSSEDTGDDELSERRRRPSGRTPERSRRPSRSREAEEPEDEYEDDDYADQDDAEDEDYADEDAEDEAEDDGDDVEYADEYEDEDYEDEDEDDEEGADDTYEDEYDDEDYADEEESAPPRRRAS